MITSGQQNVVKFIHLVSNEEKNNKCYVKECILKSFKKLCKTFNESISCNVPRFFYLKSTRREIGHSKGTHSALGHSSTQGTWEFIHLGTRDTLFSRLISNISFYNIRGLLWQVRRFSLVTASKRFYGRPHLLNLSGVSLS